MPRRSIDMRQRESWNHSRSIAAITSEDLVSTFLRETVSSRRIGSFITVWRYRSPTRLIEEPAMPYTRLQDSASVKSCQQLRPPCGEPFPSRDGCVRFHVAILSFTDATAVRVALPTPAGTFLTDGGCCWLKCGRFAGVGCARLCFVGLGRTGTPWQVIEFAACVNSMDRLTIRDRGFEPLPFRQLS